MIQKHTTRTPFEEPDTAWENSLFAPRVGVPWADPVEALLNLHELRLIEQANELIHAMRSAS